MAPVTSVAPTQPVAEPVVPDVPFTLSGAKDRSKEGGEAVLIALAYNFGKNLRDRPNMDILDAILTPNSGTLDGILSGDLPRTIRKQIEGERRKKGRPHHRKKKKTAKRASPGRK